MTARGRPARVAELGSAIAEARACGTCWKLLERLFGLSRRQLYRILLKHRGEDWPVGPPPEDRPPRGGPARPRQ